MTKYWITLYDYGNGETILESNEFYNEDEAKAFFDTFKGGFTNSAYDNLILSVMKQKKEDEEAQEIHRFDFKYGTRF